MSFELGFNDPIKITWNVDENGNKISVQMQPESHTVVNGKITLIQIPDKFQKVQVDENIVFNDPSTKVNEYNFYEINDFKTPLGVDKFRVDYQSGIITFYPSHEGKSITVTRYYGRGVILTPSSRIYSRLDEAGNVVETIQNIIDNGQAGISALDDVVNFKHVGDYISGETYSRYNIVSYKGSSFMANIDTSNNPTNSDWTRVSIGSEWQGVYNSANTYGKGNQVIDSANEIVYVSLIDNNTNNLLSDTLSWEKSVDISSVVATAEGKITDVTNLESTVSTNENGRESAETTRVSQENTRISNETSRVDVEDIRDTNETSRIGAEIIRESNETTRQSQESDRQTNTATAITNTETATINANTQGDYANLQGDYALTQGDIASVESSNLSTLKTDVQTATTNANTATDSADVSAINANTQGDYALVQGGYAKTEADRLVATDASSLQTEITDNSDKIGILTGAGATAEKADKEYVDTHLAETMPHLIVDIDNGKTYRHGRRFKDGGMQTIWEEVV